MDRRSKRRRLQRSQNALVTYSLGKVTKFVASVSSATVAHLKIVEDNEAVTCVGKVRSATYVRREASRWVRYYLGDNTLPTCSEISSECPCVVHQIMEGIMRT